jgi:hypothetical protein
LNTRTPGSVDLFTNEHEANIKSKAVLAH